MDEWQCDFAFAQIAGQRLADSLGVAGEVQEVVHQLERDTEIEPVLAKRLLLLVLDLSEHAANLCAAAEQVRRLPSHDVEVLVLGDVGVAVLGQLIQLALDHLQRDVAKHPDNVEGVMREGQGHRLDVQIVAEKHRDVVAPP